MIPKGFHFPPAQARVIAARRAETIARNRAARLAALAALTPAERAEDFASRRATRSAAARKGWRTRRAKGQTFEPTAAVRLFAADVAALRRIGPDAKQALRQLLAGLGMV